MPKKIRTEAPKADKRFVAALCLVLVLAVGIIVVLGTGDIVLRAQASSGISAQVAVSGNDVIVDLHGGDSVNDLRSVTLFIEGQELSHDAATVIIPRGVRKIIYPNITLGVTSAQMLGVSGLFKDGTSVTFVKKGRELAG